MKNTKLLGKSTLLNKDMFGPENTEHTYRQAAARNSAISQVQEETGLDPSGVDQ